MDRSEYEPIRDGNCEPDTINLEGEIIPYKEYRQRKEEEDADTKGRVCASGRRKESD